MPEPEAVPVAEDEFPLPFGIDADSGKPIPSHFPGRPDLDAAAVVEFGQPGAADHLAIPDIDPNKLKEAGWGVVYAEGTPQEVKDALAPLLEHRKAEAGDLFRVFEGAKGLREGELPDAWVERNGSSFRMVDPKDGVPLYLLLVGDPTRIPFEFQYLLDLHWSAGRLEFDTAKEYAAYAEKVVAYEKLEAAKLPTRKTATLFCTKNPGDRATGLLHNQAVKPMLEGSASVRKLDGVKDFRVRGVLAGEAQKQRLLRLLRGEEAGGRPAFLFTGSHGIRVKDNEARAREENGALLCQDWPGFGPTQPEHLLRAEDVTSSLDLSGMIHYLFACYGAGCPALDNFDRGSDGKPPRLLQQPIVSRLAQRMLRQGALAVLGHVDRAWTYSFQSGKGRPQVQDIRSVIVRLFQGDRLGKAMEEFNTQWATLAALMQEKEAQAAAGFGTLSPQALANLMVARNDARNYIILGDPAVRLRANELTAADG